MKVKDILELLKGIETEEKFLVLLKNVGIKADLETDIKDDILKKLSKKYKMDFKPVKKKAEPKKETKPEVKVEEVKVEVAPEPIKKEEPKVEEKTEKVVEKPKAEPKKEETKKPEEKPLSKEEKQKEEIKEVELSRVYDDAYNEYVSQDKEYTRIKNARKKKGAAKNEKRQGNIRDKKKPQEEKVVYYMPNMSPAILASALNISYGEVVKKLIELGYMVSATEALDRDVVEILADEFGFALKDKIEEDITKFEELVIEDDEENLKPRPAVVTIMGHVDHGKTTLLDTIRNSHVTAGEAGGITQHIGAYQVKKKDQLITFIDTPGHAAFTEMRARGAEVTDIVVLVVAADDGVMPQTREAIDHAQAAKVPIIVAVNKMDKPQANPDRVKTELAQLNLVAEEWGGNTIFVPISALTGMGVDDLLDMILLTAEMENYRANPDRLGMGVVIEAKLDKGRGPVATLLVKNGTIKVGDPVVVGNTYGKIRAMSDEVSNNIKVALPSKAIEVTGLVDVPQAGDKFMVFEDEKTARLIAEERNRRAFDLEMSKFKRQATLANSGKELSLIIKCDVQGSAEALRNSIEKINVEGVEIHILRASVGSVTETDIILAEAEGAVIIGFNVRPNAAIMKFAKDKGVEIRLYNIIYKVLEDLEAAMKGMLDPVYEEKNIGEAEVRSIFKASKVGTIAGCYVTDGIITRGCGVRLIRDNIEIYKGKLSSLKRFKDDVKEVKLGFECGLTIENYNDIKEGDRIEAFVMEQVNGI